MRIPEGHNDKYTLKVWKRTDKRVQKSFEEQLKESINKGKAKVEKKLQRNILDTIIQRKWNVEKIKIPKAKSQVWWRLVLSKIFIY